MSQSYEPSYTADATHDPTQPKDPRSLGEIVGDITTDLSTLVKQELEMAKTELRQEATTAGRGIGMLAGAALAGLLLMIFASLALTWLLDNWLPVEAAALIVAAIWAIVAGVLASAGRTALQKSNPQLPQTQQTLKEDAAWARAQKN
ncbi:phage holin family protein [Nocardioides bigeumensis]|uniref:Phage holin family protein n=1 Tax=Nocardioides bigeumensis TaxID=433657 RepID=A0ABN2Y3U4_9ACTN